MTHAAGPRACQGRTIALHRAAAIVCLTPLLLAVPAIALDAPPPHRVKRARPATTVRASRETTGSIAPPSSKTPVVKTPSAMLAGVPDPGAPDEAALPPPFNLPTASRARMRACGERWRQMKLDGEAGDEIWRDFATTCLAAKNDPVAPSGRVQGEAAQIGATASDKPSAPDAQRR